MNTGAPSPGLDEARARVLGIQAKLHRWAADGPDRRFGDLFNLVCDPAFLLVGWDRVRGNRGARTAGVDGIAPRAIAAADRRFLRELRDDLKSRTFSPLPVRERMIPKASGKLRRLGIPTARDRVVQASLKLVLEPVFEADFKPSSYGFRPNRRAQDAIEEIRHFTHRSYEWILEGDIASCFDEISHSALLDRVRERVADRRVLALVKAFLIAGILTQDGALRGTKTGAPQGGILSPLLANIALSVLDEHFAEAWQTMATDAARRRRRRHGEPLYRLVRYADDFVVLVSGTKAQAEALVADVAGVLSRMGLRLSAEKTGVCHIDEGFEFLGFRIQRQVKRGSKQAFVYSWPAKKALASIMAMVKAITRQPTSRPLSDLLRQLNRALRGWTVYFRHGVSKQTFDYLGHYTWRRVVRWLRRKHRRATWKSIRRRYMRSPTPRMLVPHDGGIALINAGSVPVTRYRYRGAKIATPWTEPTTTTKATT
ncbi:MAG TPA: group II intron reverse transcriptase/maturase [Gaiellales bacterium]|nr:group II intron reverse transcriptase/maturase [Gaiellales bacterium]